MEKKKFNFKKFGIVLCICFITLFAFIPFVNFNNIGSVNASEIDTVSVSSGSDDVTYSYTFTSSDLYYIDTYFHSYSANYLATCLFSASSSYLSGTDYITITPYFYNVSVSGLNLSYNDYSLFIAENGTYIEKDSFKITRGTYLDAMFSYSSTGINSYGDYYMVRLYSSSNFNCNVVKIVLSISSDINIPSAPNGFKYLSLHYYDVNGEYIVFSFIVSDSFVFNTRTYYLTSNFTDNDIYIQGVTDGYNQGYNIGLNDGYDKGFSAGEIVGFDDGYNNGINDSNQYSFYNLFGAVLDAPVKVFSGLFNFNLLGVNLLGLITGLFTLAVVIVILKKVMGGK